MRGKHGVRAELRRQRESASDAAEQAQHQADLNNRYSQADAVATESLARLTELLPVLDKLAAEERLCRSAEAEAESAAVIVRSKRSALRVVGKAFIQDMVRPEVRGARTMFHRDFMDLVLVLVELGIVAFPSDRDIPATMLAKQGRDNARSLLVELRADA